MKEMTNLVPDINYIINSSSKPVVTILVPDMLPYDDISTHGKYSTASRYQKVKLIFQSTFISANEDHYEAGNAHNTYIYLLQPSPLK